MNNGFKVYASLFSAEEANLGRLAEWLTCRAAEEESDAMEEEKEIPFEDRERLEEARGAFDENVAVGQIRILSKQFTTAPEVIPYVAVVDEWEPGVWLVIPFSQYGVPAIPGEMATGIDIRGLRVLQAWNGRTVQNTLMRKSFHVGELPPEVRENALALFRHEFAGTELPESFSAERGSPITMEADPRNDYIAETIERLQPLSEAVLRTAEQGATRTKVARLQAMWTRFEAVLRTAEQGATRTKGEILQAMWTRFDIDQVRLAAATETDRAPLLLSVDALEEMLECRDLSRFPGYYEGDNPRKLAFEIDTANGRLDVLPDAAELPVEVRLRKDRDRIVGTGKLAKRDDGRWIAHVEIGNVDSPCDIDGVEDLVLVVIKE